MLREEQLIQELDLKRRRAYSATAGALLVVTGLFSLRDLLQRDWSNLPSSLISAAICLTVLLAIHRLKMSTVRLNYGISLLLLVAILPEFLPDLNAPVVRTGHYLSYLLITALWFGLLPLRQAALLSLGGYLAFAVLVLTRPTFDLNLLLYLGGVATVVGMVASFGQQVTVRREEAAKFQQQALTDALTGLPNRRAATNQLQELWEASRSKTLASFSLLMLDLDDFKLVNDRFGHTVGDQVLSAVGAALRPLIGPGDLLARWGGEEFMLMLPHTTAHQAYATSARLHGATLHLGGDLPDIQFSAGAVLSHEAATLDDLLTLADERLHAAKTSGRSQVKWNSHPNRQDTAVLVRA